MTPYASGVGRELREELRGLSGHPFQTRCGAVLKLAYQSSLESMPMKEVDQSGIDFYTLEANEDKIIDAFQCKGFEVAEFDKSQCSQCLDSIESFKQSTYKVNSYYLVVNRIVKGEYRQTLESALQELVTSQKAKQAELLGLEAFIKLVFSRISTEVEIIMQNSLAMFLNEHRERMDEEFYETNVPFSVEGQIAIRNNPLSFIQEQNVSIALAENNKRTWTFVVGEFGYGKTSLLLQVANSIQQHKIVCLYLPIAQFHETAFSSEHEFLWDILAILRREDVARTLERDQFQIAALKNLLKSEKRICLFLDGLDEHPTFYREGGLARMFDCVKTFNSTCLFSARKEFLDDRAGIFQRALRGNFRHDSFTLHFQPWGDPLVLRFARKWRNNIADTTAKQRVVHFERAVESGEYIQYYGDIPKRPLFLRMLLSDIVERDLREINLAELYLRYLKQKFLIDRETSTGNPQVRRPLAMEEDYEYVCESLFKIMTLVAGRMFRNFTAFGYVALEATIEESAVRDIAAKVSGNNLDLPSVLLNSVLVPFGKRGEFHPGAISVAFAHKSFQEFFLARYIFDLVKADANELGAFAGGRLPKEVERFLTDLLNTLQESDKQRALELLRRIHMIL